MNAPGFVGVVVPQKAQFEQPLRLRSGAAIDRYELAYETYGKLNASHTNAVLVCHALNASHHVAGIYAGRSEQRRLVGQPGRPGKPLDTNVFSWWGE
jgi:homoserine O-acetyltransferase